MKIKKLKLINFCIIFSFIASILLPLSIFAKANKKVKTRETQEVNFSEMNLKGTIRNPDGAYLVQKKGIKFMPLHEVQKNLDSKIRQTASYIE